MIHRKCLFRVLIVSHSHFHSSLTRRLADSSHSTTAALCTFVSTLQRLPSPLLSRHQSAFTHSLSHLRILLGNACAARNTPPQGIPLLACCCLMMLLLLCESTEMRQRARGQRLTDGAIRLRRTELRAAVRYLVSL